MIFEIPITPFVIAVIFFVVLSGLTFLALRRRDEILEEFLVPEPNKATEKQFLDRLGVVLEELPPSIEEEAVVPPETDGDGWAVEVPAWVNQQQLADPTG